MTKSGSERLSKFVNLKYNDYYYYHVITHSSIKVCAKNVVRFLDNFRNFRAIEFFSSRMCSHRNKDNFKVKITGTTEIYTGEK